MWLTLFSISFAVAIFLSVVAMAIQDNDRIGYP
jgi:hypothetical protein